VIIADMRSSMAAEKFSAAVGCVLDFDILPAQRAAIRRGRLGSVKFGARAPGNLALS
jgi:hypothetical protein